MKRRTLALVMLVLAVISAGYVSVQPRAATNALPEELADKVFWALSSELSEPNGYFRSDNLLSNEIWMQYVIPDLVKRVPPGRVYLGVGPEQNFTYIAAVKPAMAFIVDVRRGNLHLHLMYKALFELSDDRADFLARLFARKRPAGLTTRSTAEELFSAFAEVPGSEALYRQNLEALQEHLVKTRGLPLDAEDRAGIEYVAHEFYLHGPGIRYTSGRGMGPWGRRMPDYAELMLSTDEEGRNHAYLATEESFQALKRLHARNLLVPVVGNFGGPKALRAVGSYIRDAGALVGVFYLSNVEDYLHQQGLMDAFCRNVASLPLDAGSTFIRSYRGARPSMFTNGFRPPGLVNDLGRMQEETAHCR